MPSSPQQPDDQVFRPNPLTSILAIALFGGLAYAAWSAQISQGGHAWIPALLLSSLTALLALKAA